MTENKLPDVKGIVAILIKWRYKILVMILVATTIALVTALLLPKKYLSTATIFPANSLLTDKGHLFNNNIQQLYSPYGNSDDLDRLFAIASSPGILAFVCDSLHLADHYLIDASPGRQMIAEKELKNNTAIMKSENGELRIEVWDRNNVIAAGIAQIILYKLQLVSNDLIMQSNIPVLNAMKESAELLHDTAFSTGQNVSDKKLYEHQAKELEVNLKAIPPAFAVLEKPSPSLKPGKPDILLITIAALFLSSIFCVISVLIVERLK